MKTRIFPRKRPGAAGVSLVELLIVMAIVGVLTAGMYSLFLTTSETYSDQAVTGRMLQNATSAMKRITQDLRGSGTFYAPACAGILPTAIASTSTASSLTIATLLDDPAARTEIATTPTSGQPQSNTTIGVLSVSGWSVNDIAYLTDGVKCTRFTVTEMVTGANPGLRHVPANDTNSTGALGYTYPVATSMVYRVGLNQTITYGLDGGTPAWLTRNTGGAARRFAPDVQSVSFGYLDSSGATVTPATNAAGIRAVTVSLQVRGDTLDSSVRPNVTGGFRTQRLTSTVQLRNFGS